MRVNLKGLFWARSKLADLGRLQGVVAEGASNPEALFNKWLRGRFELPLPADSTCNTTA